MKRIVFLATLVISAAAWAQAPKPESPKAEPIKAAPAKKPAAMAKKNSRRSEDARQCLERATNNEIIKCAEEYL